MSGHTAKHWLTNLASMLLVFSAAVVPIFFLPGLVDPGNWTKRILISQIALALAALWIIQTLLTKRALFTLTKTSLLLLAFAGVTAVSALFTTNAWYHLTNFPIFWLMVAVLVLFGSTMAHHLRWATILKTLHLPATILVISSLLELTPFGLSQLFNQIFGMNYPTGLTFSPADSFFGVLTFVIPIALATLFQGSEDDEKTHEHLTTYKIWSGILLVSSVALGVIGLSNPTTRPLILPWSTGWTIAVETLKTPQTLLLGFGPNSFLNAFHQLRGLSYNTFDIWAVRFATSSSEFLTLLTTSGLLSVGVLIYAARSAFPLLSQLHTKHLSLVVYLVLHGLAFLVLPFTPLLWFTFSLGILLMIQEASLLKSEEVWQVEIPPSAKFPLATPFISAALVGGLIAAVTFLTIPPIRSNYLLGYSLKQNNKGDAQSIYDARVKAMALTPYHPEYRRALASTSFTIVQALSQQATQKGTPLTAEEEKLSLDLLQQAINEARNAVALDPTNTESWEVLADIYSNVLSVDGAQDWAIAARTQAIQTDPTNPELRVELGQLYGRLSQPENALRFYEQAIQLQPRWAQPYYLFGDTALTIKNGAAAAIAFQKTLELVDPNVPERAVIEDKLRAAQELASQQAAAASASAKTLPPTQPNQEAQTGTEILESSDQPAQPETPEVNTQPTGFGELLSSP